MPRQQTFMTTKVGNRIIEVLKTYDQAYAREVFKNMDDAALTFLAASLDLTRQFVLEEIPKPTDDSYEEFLWDVMLDSAREDWKNLSYYVVIRSDGHNIEELFVSPDWPTAESYVKHMGIDNGTAIGGSS